MIQGSSWGDKAWLDSLRPDASCCAGYWSQLVSLVSLQLGEAHGAL